MADPLGDSVPLTGDPRIDVVTQGGSWGFGAGPHELSYSFSVLPGGASWSPESQDAVAQILAAWSAVTNLTFTEIDSGSSINGSSADLAFALANGQIVNQGFIGIGDFPDPASADDFRLSLSLAFNQNYSVGDYARPEGDIVVESAYPGFAYLQPGGDGYLTILHEIGHALGLKHPFDDGANGRPTAQQLGVPQYDCGR